MILPRIAAGAAPANPHKPDYEKPRREEDRVTVR
jgi:hypothetical protein